MVPVNSGFHMQRITPKIILNLGMHSQNFFQPCPRPKKIKEYHFKEFLNY